MLHLANRDVIYDVIIGRTGCRLTVAFSARILWERGKPIEVRMAMLSSGGRLLLIGAAPTVLSLVDGPASIMEGRMSGSAKSEETQMGAQQSFICLYM